MLKYGNEFSLSKLVIITTCAELHNVLCGCCDQVVTNSQPPSFMANLWFVVYSWDYATQHHILHVFSVSQTRLHVMTVAYHTHSKIW